MSAPGPREPLFEVLAIVTSAGGLEAMSIVLSDLPADTSLAVVVGQHLGAESTLPEILARRTRLPAEWASHGGRLVPGRIHVAPPHARLELLPDGSMSLSPMQRPLLQDRPLDALLRSMAESCGPRALAVVLTGMGADGAQGARAVKNAGGAVLVQRVAEAAYPEMPRAAVEAGAAHLELPLAELGRTVGELLAGGRLPQPRNEGEAHDALFGGPGPAREALRAVDWAGTSLGAVLDWPRALTAVVPNMLDVQFPMCIAWGDDFVQLYNDAWLAVIGHRHPEAAGLPARVTWRSHWLEFAPHFRRVVEAGETRLLHDCRIDTDRHGFVEEAYFTLSTSALRDERGNRRGVMMVATERSASVLAERRLQTLRRLAAVQADQVSVACERLAAVAEENPRDLPFVLVYAIDVAELRAALCGAAGLRPGSGAAPRSVELLTRAQPWPLGTAVRQRQVQTMQQLSQRLRGHDGGDWEATPDAAMVWPLHAGDGAALAVLVTGLAPKLALDDAYRGFLESVARQMADTLEQARARERDREQLQALAALDLTRAEFFSNVSHEFRTPLTLLLAPLDDLLASRDTAFEPMRRELELAARNARRLLGLVDTLLDFSRIEAGRLPAHFRPLDLSVLTADIAGLFRSAAERAGLALEVECPPAPRRVMADEGMWEKIVSNLLSNALKFTFEGRILVRLTYLPQHVQLEVVDSGIGVPAHDQPRIFQRFHRVRGLRARTDEGAGIGLAIVAELARLHHGRVRVTDAPGQGSTFTVWLPTMAPPPAVHSAAEPPPAHDVALRLAGEAEGWSAPHGAPVPAGIIESMLGPAPGGGPAGVPGPRLLVVDDNVDMRDYLARSLSPCWQVECAADGVQALARARERPPDLILADVMMPRMDGFALLRAVRADPVLRDVPVVLVTARAHETAAIEGLLAGADDYVAKPFSSRELAARLRAQLELARVRRRGEREVRALLSVMPVGVYACDPAGRFSYWNRRAVELWGAEPGAEACDWALLGAPAALDRAGRPLQPQDAAMARVLRTGEAVVDEERVALRADGGRLDLLLSIRPLHEDGRAVGAVCALVDVTARKLAERALLTLNEELERRVAERTLELAASHRRQAYLLRLSDALRLLDDARSIQAAASGLLARTLGADRVCYARIDDGDWLVDTVHEQGAAAAAPLAPGRYPLALFGAWVVEAFAQDLRLVAHDLQADPRFDAAQRSAFARWRVGSWLAVPLLKNGRVVAALSVATAAPRRWDDAELALAEGTAERTWAAVERSRAEAALRESEERFRGIVMQTAAGICRTDLDGTLRYANRTFCDLLGWSGEAGLLGRALWALVDGDGTGEARQAFGRLGQAVETETLELRLRRRDGTLLWASLSLSALRGGDGRPQSALAVVLDISARKAAQAELQARNDELERFSRSIVGRELRMIELKEQVNGLLRRLGEAPRFRLEQDAANGDGDGG